MNKLAVATGLNINLNRKGSSSPIGSVLREDLSSHYNLDPDDLEFFSVYDIRKNPEVIGKFARFLAEGNTGVWTHSAGPLSLEAAIRRSGGKLPDFVDMQAPPLVTPIHELMGMRSLRLMIAKHRTERADYGSEGAKLARQHDGELARELRHPARLVGNIGAVPDISKFDAVMFGRNLAHDGVQARASWYAGDKYFQPTDAQMRQAELEHLAAKHAGGNFSAVRNLHGHHDTPVMHPGDAMAAADMAHDMKRAA